jgi:hypothetical protein
MSGERVVGEVAPNLRKGLLDDKLSVRPREPIKSDSQLALAIMQEG